MFILIILMSYSTSHQNSTSQQITFKTKEACEKAAEGVRQRRYVQTTFCVQTDAQ